MVFADIHLHSTFSSDGISTMEEHCNKALDTGIGVICFTDHVDYNEAEYNLGKIKDNRNSNFDIDSYFREIKRLKSKYTQLEILSGIEFSEPHLFYDIFEEYKKQPFDYIIAAIHHCYNSVFPGYENLCAKQAIEEYYDLMLSTLEQCEFDSIAHMDFPRRYYDKWDIPLDILDNILKTIIRKDIALEINTSSVDQIMDEPLPSYSIIQKYKELGGRKIVMGSDAHDCKNLGKAFRSVITKIPEELVVGYYRQRQFIELNTKNIYK